MSSIFIYSWNKFKDLSSNYSAKGGWLFKMSNWINTFILCHMEPIYFIFGTFSSWSYLSLFLRTIFFPRKIFVGSKSLHSELLSKFSLFSLIVIKARSLYYSLGVFLTSISRLSFVGVWLIANLFKSLRLLAFW